MNDAKQIELLGMDSQELTSLVEQAGEPGYRGRQLFEAVYSHRIDAIDQISTLPGEFRKLLSNRGIRVGQPAIEKKFTSRDGTVRYLV